MTKKVIRTLTYFLPHAVADWQPTMARIAALYDRAIAAGYEVQTLRLCSPHLCAGQLPTLGENLPLLLCSWGTLDMAAADFESRVADWWSSDDALFFNINLQAEPTRAHVDFLMETLKRRPLKLFHFAYTVAAADNRSPFFPSAHSEREGFAVGLQTTDLAVGAATLGDWLERKRAVWAEIIELFGAENDFMGIDSSVAPLFENGSSLFEHLARWYPNYSMSRLATMPIFTQITNFIKTQNPMPTGLCGLMLPCLEDFALARHYDNGDFDTERNLYLSLHSGLGIDTYPFGIDQDAGRMLEVLQLLYALGTKYKKPLSVRWISDGISKIGEQSRFENQFLLDAKIRAI